MSENALVSVIVAVYNVENYFEKCIQSIINQDYKNLEIFLVDDGSTDSSGKMCDDFAKKDERIKVIHQKNAGQSAARNTAIKLSKGKYVTFLDSDDFWDKDCISFLVNLIEENKAELSISAVRHLGFPQQKDKDEKIDTIKIIEGKDLISSILLGTNGFTASANHTLFLGDICRKTTFKEGVIYEDLAYMINYCFEINKAVTSKKRSYNYVYRKNNSSSAATLKRKHDLDFITNNIKEILNIKAPELIPCLNSRYVSNAISLLRSLQKNEKDAFNTLRESIIKIDVEKSMQTKSDYLLYKSLKSGKLLFHITNAMYNLFRRLRYLLKK